MDTRGLLVVALSSLALACGDPAATGETGETDETDETAGTETGGTPDCDEGLVAGEDGDCHCGAAGGPVCSEDGYCDASAATCAEPVCSAEGPWTPGTLAFAEVTDSWGLAGVEGVRISVTDIDGDGWADLFVRRGGTRSDDFAGARHTWLLRNLDGAGFEDRTEASGVLATRSGLGPGVGRPAEVVASADVDNDGDLDIFTGITTSDPTASLGETSELMLNDGDGTFTLGPADSELRNAAAEDVVAGASFVDINHDGLIDIWVTEHGIQDHLYYGIGDGRFIQATGGSGLATTPLSSVDDLNAGRSHSRAWSALACDLNGDGWTELLAGSYGRSTNHLWQGRFDAETGLVLFTNRSVDSGYGRDDNYEWQSNQFAQCYCQANPTAEGCADVPAPSINCSTPNWNHGTDREPYRLGGNSGAVACADLDNDGDMDLYTGEIRHWWAGLGSDMSEALINTGAQDVVFERPGRESMGIVVDHVTGLSWDEGHMSLTTLDFDNDGWRDVYVGASDYAGNRGLLFHQRAALQFEPVATADSFEHNRSHGVASADFDRDGDLDLIVGHSRARCDANAPNDCYETQQIRMFENLLGDGGGFVQLQLEGVDANRSAIGARVSVTADGLTQVQEVGGGYGHYGAQDDLVLHFGLGEACSAQIEIRWPDAELSVQALSLPAGHRYRVRQGERATLVPHEAP